ncbi:MAG: Yip1 family protein [Candidatus Methanofastidiosia archaeon]
MDLLKENLVRLRNAMTLREKVFEKTRMPSGFIFILLVGLFVGFFSNLDEAFKRETAPEAEIPSFEEISRYNPALRDMPPEARENMEYYMNQIPLYIELSMKTKALETQPLKSILEFIGGVVSEPFGFLRFWIFYGALVLLSSKVLGGEAKAERFFGATSLWCAPHILKMATIIPILGGVASSLAWLWGLIVYVNGVRISQGFDWVKSIVALILPVVVFIALGFFAILLFLIALAI